MKKKTIGNIIAFVITAVIVALCAVFIKTTDMEATSMYYSTFVALLPPLVAIALALITKEVYSSLFVGILLGGLFVSNWQPVGALDAFLNDGIIAAISGTAGIFMFLVILGALVALVNKSGGSAAFGRWAKKNIKSRTGAAIATLSLACLSLLMTILTA